MKSTVYFKSIYVINKIKIFCLCVAHIDVSQTLLIHAAAAYQRVRSYWFATTVTRNQTQLTRLKLVF